MSAEVEADRIRNEYRRRDREISADFYSLYRPENLFFRHGQERAIVAGLTEAHLLPLTNRRVLEIGCGRGQWLGLFEQLGAAPDCVAGIDLNAERCSEAKRSYPIADLRCGNAATLSWPDASFDVVVQSTVFTSILDSSLRTAVALEMLRVLKPTGALYWYDFSYNNPRNPGVRAIGRREIRKLFPNCQATFRRVTLAPPLARRLVPRSWRLAALLEMTTVFNTHLAAVIRPV